MKLMVQKDNDAMMSRPKYTPSNRVAVILAEMMRVDWFNTTNLLSWIAMGGTVEVDGREWKGDR